MAVEMLSLSCPKCGANLNVATNRESFFCEYCGQKIYISDSNHQKYTYRKIDDARIRETEARERVRLKELELEQEKLRANKDKDKQELNALFLALGFAIGCFLLIYILF